MSDQNLLEETRTCLPATELKQNSEVHRFTEKIIENTKKVNTSNQNERQDSNFEKCLHKCFGCYGSIERLRTVHSQMMNRFVQECPSLAFHDSEHLVLIVVSQQRTALVEETKDAMNRKSHALLRLLELWLQRLMKTRMRKQRKILRTKREQILKNEQNDKTKNYESRKRRKGRKVKKT